MLADRPRPDVIKAGWDQLECGFDLRLPAGTVSVGQTVAMVFPQTGEKLPGSPTLVREDRSSDDFQCHVEFQRGSALTGWAASKAGRLTELGLISDDWTLPLYTHWTPRADVQRALGHEEVLLGFEVSLPRITDESGLNHSSVALGGFSAGAVKALPAPISLPRSTEPALVFEVELDLLGRLGALEQNGQLWSRPGSHCDVPSDLLMLWRDVTSPKDDDALHQWYYTSLLWQLLRAACANPHVQTANLRQLVAEARVALTPEQEIASSVPLSERIRHFLLSITLQAPEGGSRGRLSWMCGLLASLAQASPDSVGGMTQTLQLLREQPHNHSVQWLVDSTDDPQMGTPSWLRLVAAVHEARGDQELYATSLERLLLTLDDDYDVDASHGESWTEYLAVMSKISYGGPRDFDNPASCPMPVPRVQTPTVGELIEELNGLCSPEEIHLLADVDWYANVSDAAVSTVPEALEHYLRYGWKAGLTVHPAINDSFIREQCALNGLATNAPGLLLLLRHESAYEVSPHALFDPKYFSERHSLGAPTWLEFLTNRELQQLRTSPYFSPENYWEQLGGVDPNRPALVDYFISMPDAAGNPRFHDVFYRHNAGPLPISTTPLAHYLNVGVYIGLPPNPFTQVTQMTPGERRRLVEIELRHD